MKTTIIALCLSLLAITVQTQTITDFPVRVATYQGDRACAISYTFDDGLKEQYTLVAPFFDRLGFKGTFYINGGRVNESDNAITDTTRVTWANLKEMAMNGHEISNHGWLHRNFKRFSFEEIKEDVDKNDSAIIKHIGIWARSFCYPNNAKTPEGVAYVTKNRVGSRTVQRSIGSKSTPEDLEKWVDKLIENKEWGVGMTHGITYGYDAFGNPQRFWEHLEKVKSMEDKVWVGTFAEVAAYTKEREEVQLSITKNKKSITVTPTLTLDKKLYYEPLTLVIDRSNIQQIAVKQGKKNLPVHLTAEKAMFDFDPHGGAIVISVTAGPETKRPAILIAGDSTAQHYEQEKHGFIRGWAQMLSLYLAEGIQIRNHAIGGRSTKTFISEGRWDKLLSEVTPGDYVFIQFGHNDASTRPERHASYEDYEKNLIKMINDTKARGGNPILLTSVVMRTFQNGHLVDDRLKGYPIITRRVAKEMNVPMIDANQKTRDFITMLGDEASKPYYRWLEAGIDPFKPDGIQDDTHMMEKGAKQVALLVAEGIKELGIELSQYIR
ncbi:hypothetical protein D0T50_00670 [Bacteroides sp. 214]|uniref:polysaccharide deacetylase family protein n=1 Tax=Bacteroides sp. 214 TaxID=2302935 RepID=UPI0013D1311E|nr:polysaccharide deacetylase family protein [Bacteroides sp. 214]NDW11401.1 hypothetical protein [Bacteroides sp. 214]